ncbi:unnamed protein product [Vicia faba]|uniref:Mei2-like C-terminal RNA recognition motif domain-containing protein n=1 Tax=Vicia faba TaxID=3906 RepID=A0AAV1B600_VICFA|nr:unnamed protein product [Vicia faba]
MASTVASGLTAEAPEFHPTNHVQKLHPPYLTFTPLRHQPSYPFFYYYYPTATKHHFHSFRFHANHPLTTATPAFPPSSGMKNEIAVEAQSSEGNDGEIEDRRSHRLRIPRLEWRKKGGDDAETYPKLKNESFRRNHHKEYVNIQQQHSRASTDGKNKASIFPVVPVRPDGDETTVMIKNVPSKYTRDMIVKFLENHCMVENAKDKENGQENTFDFVYLPIDFRTGLNKGYAFVNFTKPSAAWRFLVTASNQKWELFLSHKIRDVVAARLQGKEKLEKHFVSVNFPCESNEVLPLCFSPPRDGVIKGNQRTLGRLLYKSR